jgi:hypothetical protein
MTDEIDMTTPNQETTPEPKIVINEVISVTAQPQDGVFQFHANITEQGVSRDIEFGYIPGDPYGFTPFFTAWMDENPTFPITPYAEPTVEEIRARMPAITPRQLRLTLVRSGISLTSVSDAIAALPNGLVKEETEIEWEYATTFQRTSVTLLTIAAALDMSAEDVDVLWSQAVAI